MVLERLPERRQHRQRLSQRTRISCFTAILQDKGQHKTVATSIAFFQHTKIMTKEDCSAVGYLYPLQPLYTTVPLI